MRSTAYSCPYSEYLVRMRENADQNNAEYEQFLRRRGAGSDCKHYYFGRSIKD